MTLLARVAPPVLFGSRRAGLLIERNLMVYRRGWLVIVSGFFEPLFYLLSIGLGLGALVGSVYVNGQEIPYTAFVAPALLASSAMNGAIYDSTFNVFFKLNYAKTYDAILSTPVGVGDVALGEIGWALIRGGIYAAAFLVVMFVLGMVLSPWAVLAFPAALLVGFAFGAAGMAATSFMRTWQDFDLVQLVILPLFLFSATFYPITTYPEPIQTLVQLTPLYHGVDLIRGLTTGTVEPDAPGPCRLPRGDGPHRPGDLLAPPRQAAAQVGTAAGGRRAILPPMSEPQATTTPGLDEVADATTDDPAPNGSAPDGSAPDDPLTRGRSASTWAAQVSRRPWSI